MNNTEWEALKTPPANNETFTPSKRDGTPNRAWRRAAIFTPAEVRRRRAIRRAAKPRVMA